MDTATTTRSSNPSTDVVIDTTPLLGSSPERRPFRGPSIRGAARFLRRASSRRMMREPSMLVRETAAEQLEERQSDWAYSRPVVVLDIIWNLAFVVVAMAVLLLSRDENPSMPLRLWIVGYAFQCLLHIICVCVEYRRRHGSRDSLEHGENGNLGSGVHQERDDGHELDEERIQSEERTSVAKHLESANTMFSFLWWIIGFYWVSAGGQALTHDAPQLYWLCVIFLAFDVFFVVFCVALACVIGIAVCCCLPCIIAILYAVADQEGASEEDIRQLPKYKFRSVADIEKFDIEKCDSFGGIMTACGGEMPPIERALSAENAECCICLSPYEDGVDLRELPCSHHFHCACIDKWLHINATCPLCKFNIIKSSNHAREEV
ncbi:E3 ubiquitin-protein ligase At4g11680 [Amborella trichopoda]|uniref:E3 ubiquitin-protein ligase At4g11680 n=1 Tax=Amborella trichopoda TaxID=13333 RepID=UPI0005D34861|nr:E3 ubiquitin-protein ligase At4g11680 [Amborella trichopoda]XP_020531448.1 E3 ubiquitin-protein ligase At4g11680 [Amborella trichopoda]|eukprot:XP_011628339.1 E3 ubiquitin-protein ligase At4g11680 [Amborella trichopoda]